jgi:hypothetical protein
MARKTATVTIERDGRDKGKTFQITELSAYESEEWAARALFALMNAGVEIPADIASAGLAGIVSLGVSALTKLSFEQAKPLMDKMMECVQYQPSPKITRPLIEDDIEEVATLVQLREAVLKLHTDFFTNAAPLTSGSAKPQGRGSQGA